jgi:hypothetical protein
MVTHHIEIVGCGLRDVSIFANTKHDVDFRDNDIENVESLAGVKYGLWLSRNKI